MCAHPTAGDTRPTPQVNEDENHALPIPKPDAERPHRRQRKRPEDPALARLAAAAREHSLVNRATEPAAVAAADV